MKSLRRLTLFLVLTSLLLTGCIGVWNEAVAQNEVGIITDGGAFVKCVGPGIQNHNTWWANMQTYNTDPVTFNVANASVATKETQIVSVEITVQARRKSDCPSSQLIYSKWASVLDNQAMIDALSAIAADAIKGGVRQYTLTGLLDDRDGLGLSIKTELEEAPIAEVVEIVSVAVPNVDVDDAYEALLQERNNLREQINVEAQRQALIEQTYANQIFEQEQAEAALVAQLEREKAQTAVDVEIAERAGEVAAQQNAIYYENERAFELRRLELLRNVLSNKTVYFVPGDSDLNIFTNADQQVVPTGE